MNSAREQSVVTIIQHLLFGYILQEAWVYGEGEGSLAILEIAGESDSVSDSLSPLRFEIIALSNRCSDKSLKKSFSKAPLSGFLKSVIKETIELSTSRTGSTISSKITRVQKFSLFHTFGSPDFFIYFWRQFMI